MSRESEKDRNKQIAFQIVYFSFLLNKLTFYFHLLHRGRRCSILCLILGELIQHLLPLYVGIKAAFIYFLNG